MYKKILKNLIIINLVLLAIILLSKIIFIKELFKVVIVSFVIPLFIAVFFAYIITPVSSFFRKRGFKKGIAAAVSILIFMALITGIGVWFGKYIVEEFNDVFTSLKNISINNSGNNSVENISNEIEKYSDLGIKSVYLYFTNIIKNYIGNIPKTILTSIKYIINAFSGILLVLIIIFYILKDKEMLGKKLVKLAPEKYKNSVEYISCKTDEILFHYVTGQAKVALSLAVMIYIAYKIIQMPNALIFSFITFILAFIPFIGFFISMIIPTIIAIKMGWFMVIKLFVAFIIVQSLKGRVVVPTIMGNTMNIHPITDIVLVVGAVSLGGPIAAFVVVPIYSILKVIIKRILKYKKVD